MDNLTNIKLRRSKVEVNLTPTNVKKAEDGSLQKCLICIKNEARYTCPRCGLNYCSLDCFKSDRHQDCSESFYKKEVESCLRSDEVSTENKKEMIQILKRDQIDRENDEDAFRKLVCSEEDEPDDFGELLAQLTPEEKALFESALADNSILSQMESSVSYWWKGAFLIVPENAPTLRSVPPLPEGKEAHWTTELFVTNLVIGYCFIYRRYLGEPEDLLAESTDELIALVAAFQPAVTLSEGTAVTSIVDAMTTVSDTKSSLVALKDAGELLDSALKIRHVLSHIYHLLRAKGQSKEKKRLALKVDFYHGWILTLKSLPAEYLTHRVKFSAQRVEKDYHSFEEDKALISKKLLHTSLISQPVTSSNALIVELDS